MISFWSSTKNKFSAVFGLTLFWAGFMVGSAQADEVSTKIVGFVKAPMGPGKYFYSIPFQDVGEIDETQLHFVNVDNDNDGVLDTFSPGLFSDENFTVGDRISKFNKTTGRLSDLIIFRNTFYPGHPVKTGWCEQIVGTPFFQLSDMCFEAGEGFYVEFAEGHTPGEELFFLGQVNEYSIEIPITQGYNFIGNPYPAPMTLQQAFFESDNETYNPTATTGQYYPDTSSGDTISLSYDPVQKSWLRRAVYWDKPGVGKGWYYQKPGIPIWFLVPTDPSNPDYGLFLLKPTEGYLYYAKNGFIWKVESPVSN